MNDAIDAAEYGQRKRSRLEARLLLVGVVALIAVLVLTNPYDREPLSMALGGAVIVVTLAPLYRWLSQEPLQGLPVLAMHGLFYATCYGLGGFLSPNIFTGANMVNEEDYPPALLCVLVSWLSVLAGYWVGTRWHPRQRIESLQVDSPRLDTAILAAVYPGAVASSVVARSLELDALLQIVLAIRFFTFVWIVHAAWTGRLAAAQRMVAFWLVMPVEVVLFGGLSKGFLFGLLIYVLVLGITYSLTRNKVPVRAAVVVIALFLLLNPIKYEFRQLTGEYREQIGTVEGLVMFSDLAVRLYGGQGNANVVEATERAFVRSNHLLTVAAVIADTPSAQPYRYGETLVPLLTKWIPRALWPEKPLETLGNTWAKDYGYISLDDFATSYNLPWVAEMHMNFGLAGIVGLSVLLGAAMGALAGWANATHAGSAHFAFTLTLASAFFFPESNISGQVGSLVVWGASSLVLVFVLVRILGRGEGAPAGDDVSGACGEGRNWQSPA